MKWKKVTVAFVLSAAVLAGSGQFSSQQESADARPAQAATTQHSVFQAPATDIKRGKHWGD